MNLRIMWPQNIKKHFILYRGAILKSLTGNVFLLQVQTLNDFWIRHTDVTLKQLLKLSEEAPLIFCKFLRF